MTLPTNTECKHMKKITTFCLLAAFAVCQAAQASTQFTGEELDKMDMETKTNLANCLTENARKLDDGVSDANTVAFTVSTQCVVQFNKVEELVVMNATNPRARLGMLERLSQQRPQKALPYVLENRSKNTKS